LVTFVPRMNDEKYMLGFFTMELVKNRASGKPFILLDDTADGYLVLITPEGKVKRLERHLFGSPISADLNNSQLHSHLTPAQMDKYIEREEYMDY